MIYYWFNRQQLLQKAKEKYSKEKAAEYYEKNKEAIKEKSKERYKNLPPEEKDNIKEQKFLRIFDLFVSQKPYISFKNESDMF